MKNAKARKPANNLPTPRAQIRMMANGELPIDAPLIVEKPKFKRRDAKKIKDLPKDWKEIMQGLAEQGKGSSSFCKHLGLDHVSLNNLLRDEPEFVKHYRWCMLVQKEWLENAGLDLIVGEKRGDAKVWALMMSNYHGYKTQNNAVQVSGNGEAPLMVGVQKTAVQLTDDELRKELERRNLPSNVFEGSFKRLTDADDGDVK